MYYRWGIIITFIWIILITGLCSAQSAFIIEGRVITESGTPIPGVEITSIPDSISIRSDTNGNFSVSSISRIDGIIASRLGFAGKIIDFKFIRDFNSPITIVLRPQAITIDGIVVRGDRKSSLPKTPKTPSIKVIDGQEIIGMPGAGQDLMRSLTALPGVVSKSDYSSKLYIRGGTPDQNLVLIDGAALSNPYRLGTFISSFNPDLVEEIRLMPGGFPAQYGDRLSSVIDVRYKRARRDGYRLKSNTSLINTSMIFEGPLYGDRAGIILSVRRTYYDLILNRMKSEEVVYPHFYDIQAKIDYDLYPNLKTEITINRSSGGFRLKTSDNEQFSSRYDLDFEDSNGDALITALLNYHAYEGLSIRTRFTRLKRFEVFRINGDADMDVDADGCRYSLRQDITLTPGHRRYRVMMGWESQNSLADFRWKLDAEDSIRNSISFNDLPVFIPREGKEEYSYEGRNRYFGSYLSFELKKWIRFQPAMGIRYDYSDFVDKSKISPRLSLNYFATDRDIIRLAWGFYYQFPTYETLSEKGYYPDVKRSEDLDAEKAVHYTFGWEHLLGKSWACRLDLYYKDLNNLVVDSYEANPVPVNMGEGYSRGIEFFLCRKEMDNFPVSGWISYSLAKVWRETPWYSFCPKYDQRHTINLVINYKIRDNINIASKWNYGSGTPYTPIIKSKYCSFVDPETDEKYGFYAPVYGRHNSGRYPSYHRLDVRINREFKWLSMSWTAYLEVINLYNRKNVYSYSWSDNYSVRKTLYELPMLPSFGFAVRFF